MTTYAQQNQSFENKVSKKISHLIDKGYKITTYDIRSVEMNKWCRATENNQQKSKKINVCVFYDDFNTDTQLRFYGQYNNLFTRLFFNNRCTNCLELKYSKLNSVKFMLKNSEIQNKSTQRVVILVARQ